MTKHNDPAVVAAPALNYLREIEHRLNAIERETAHLTEMGSRMAEGLLAGGQLFCPPVDRYWSSEFTNRAGGLMGVRDQSYQGTSNDLAYFTVPDPRRWDASKDAALGKLLSAGTRLFINGRKEDLGGVDLSRVEGFTGGPSPEEGRYAYEGVRPLAPLRIFDQFVRGWITGGEMIAACTRRGRMPILWMSVWLEGAFVRNAHFLPQGNVREPWRVPTFHENTYIPPLAAGYAAKAFVDEARRIQGAIVAQASRLAKGGQWLAEAKGAGKRIWSVAVGHSYPAVLNLAKGSPYPIEWGRPVSDLNDAVPGDLGDGDIALHLGYSPVDVGDVGKILDRGVKFIYSSPYGRPDELKDHENMLWLDIPWRPTDATVDIPAYSVRMLPMSSTAHTMAYFAILSEMAERMGWT